MFQNFFLLIVLVDGLRGKREIKSNMKIKIYKKNIIRKSKCYEKIIVSRNVIHAFIVHYELTVVIFFSVLEYISFFYLFF